MGKPYNLLYMPKSIPKILREAKTVAVVGLSDKPERYSFIVADYLKRVGYRIFPVNPMISETLGEQSYPDLLSFPERPDKVSAGSLIRRNCNFIRWHLGLLLSFRISF